MVAKSGLRAPDSAREGTRDIAPCLGNEGRIAVAFNDAGIEIGGHFFRHTKMCGHVKCFEFTLLFDSPAYATLAPGKRAAIRRRRKNAAEASDCGMVRLSESQMQPILLIIEHIFDLNHHPYPHLYPSSFVMVTDSHGHLGTEVLGIGAN